MAVEKGLTCIDPVHRGALSHARCSQCDCRVSWCHRLLPEGPKDIAVTMMLQPYPQEADIQTGRNG